MDPSSAPRTGLAQLNLFFALSRTPHGLLDMSTPAVCALLTLGRVPSLPVILIGLLTTFAGYTAVYAINDLMDWRSDREKMKRSKIESENYLDAAMLRHPIAQGALSFKAGASWAGGWSTIALIGAWWLNPVCVLIFLGGCVLEMIYCRLSTITALRILVSGGVKSAGGVAAIFAVHPTPHPLWVIAVLGWLFFWEAGGQNIPADWADIEEDRALGAKTIPGQFGPVLAARVVLATLVVAFGLSVLMLARSALPFGIGGLGLGLLAGIWFTLMPAFKLHQHQTRQNAMRLFNRASYYPLGLLTVVMCVLLGLRF